VNTRIATSIIVLLTLHNIACAQDFDADSIYYTPIPKVNSSQPEKKNNPFKELPTQPGDTATSKRFIGYFFNLQLGSLIGCEDCATDKEVTFTASTVHGVTIGDKFRIGGGIGFDSYYGWQTMPVFASASFDLLGTKNTNALFVQFNYGASVPWRTEKQWDYTSVTGVDGGPMYYGMAGLRLKYHDMRISFTIGGKFQSVSSYFEIPTIYYDVNGIPVQGASSKTTIVESMSRLALGVSIGWK
jgi:hypothetical protein